MAFERLRHWSRERVSLQIPDLVEIDLEDALRGVACPAGVAELKLPILTGPDQNDLCLQPLVASIFTDCLLLASPACSNDLSLATALPAIGSVTIRPFVEPPQCDIEGLSLWVLPQAVDVFRRLVVPGRGGKAYVNQDSAGHRKTDETKKQQPMLFEERCKHGLPRNVCELCFEQERRITRYQAGEHPVKSKPHTVDVFDLLLAYLQPPLEPLLAHPLLFPPDRRPYPYQVQGIRFLLTHECALLGDEMGLGKTIQAILGLQGLFRQGRVHKTLVLCPRSLLGTWERELRKWAPEFFVLKVRGGRDERRALWSSSAHVFLTTYETLRQDVDQGIDFSLHFDAAVLDEVQKIKNPDAGVTQAVRRLRPAFRWGMSGTPLENRIEDVVSIFNFVKPDLFRATWSPYEERAVRNRIEPYFLRRRLTDVLTELPEKVSEEVWLDLNDEQRDAYGLAYAEGRAELSEPGVSRIHVFALVNRLKQICNLDPQTKSSCKLDYLEEQLESIQANDQKALVFSQFPNKTLREVEPRLSPYGACTFDGSLGDNAREQMLKQFQEHQEPRILLMSVKAGGVGLTLTRANHVFHLDHWWNPAVARQAEARAHRIGQQSTVFVYDIFTSDTIEERIYDLLAQKQQLFDTVIDDLSTQDVQKALTDEDLFGLFDLKPPSGSRLVVSDAAQTPTGKSRFTALKPAEFEQLIAQLYTRMGFVTHVTPQSRDGGIDVVARRAGAVGRDYVIIQCKHSPAGTIGEPAVRELIGTWQSTREATQAVLVTSGRFSEGALRIARDNRIELVDGLYLDGLLKRYKVE